MDFLKELITENYRAGWANKYVDASGGKFTWIEDINKSSLIKRKEITTEEYQELKKLADKSIYDINGQKVVIIEIYPSIHVVNKRYK